MNNDEFLSQNEIDEIDKIQVDNNMLEKVKNRQARSIRKVLIDNIFEEVGKNLEDDEKVEFHVIGINYEAQRIRFILAALGFGLSHPIGWNTNNILIKTNKRFLMVGTEWYLTYSNMYEIDKEMHLFKEEQSFYLTVKDINGIERITQYEMQSFEITNKYLEDSANIIIDKKFKYQPGKFIKKIMIFQILIIVIIIFTGACGQ